VDQRAAETREPKVKEQLEEQVATLRATRDALIDQRVAEVEKIQRKYDAYVETKAIKEAQDQAKKEKVDKAHAAHFTRRAPAGGATSVDGAAAIAAIVTGKSVADQAAAELTARAMAVVLTDLAQLQVWRAEDAWKWSGRRSSLRTLRTSEHRRHTLHRAGLSAHHRPCTGMHSSTL
jgi:ATPase subunit of ABC transporter with duplicated ATPase domains